MAVLDAPLRNVSVKLINTFGKLVTITFKSTTADSYDPKKRRPHTSEATASVKAIIEAVGLVGASGSAQRDGVMVGDQMLTIAAKGLPQEPLADDTVAIGATVYRIKSVDPVYSGEEVAIYALHARR